MLFAAYSRATIISAQLSVVTNRIFHRIVLIFVLIGFCITGCRSLSTQESAGTSFPPLALAPASLGTTLQLHQKLSFTRISSSSSINLSETGNYPQEGSVETLLEVDSNMLRLAMVSFGQRLASIAFDGTKWEIQRSPRLPKALKAEDIVRDIQLTYWPVVVIQAALPNEYHVLETRNERVLLRDSTPVMRITYNQVSSEKSTPADRYARIELQNFVYGYRLLIERAQ